MKNKPRSRPKGATAKSPRPASKQANFKRDASIEEALRLFAAIKNQAVAARAAGVSPKRLRTAIRELGFATRKGRGWEITDNLKRVMTATTSSGRKRVEVMGMETASLIGKHDNAIKAFLGSNSPVHLEKYAGQFIKDAKGEIHHLEYRHNYIHRLANSDEIFEFVYKWAI